MTHYGLLSTATVFGLVGAILLGAWFGPGYDDRTGHIAIPGFLFGWASYRIFDWLTGDKNTTKS